MILSPELGLHVGGSMRDYAKLIWVAAVGSGVSTVLRLLVSERYGVDAWVSDKSKGGTGPLWHMPMNVFAFRACLVLTAIVILVMASRIMLRHVQHGR